jgi:catalase
MRSSAGVGQRTADVRVSAALTQLMLEPGTIAGRKVGVIADTNADLSSIGKLRRALAKHGATVHVIAPVGGVLSDTNEETVERTLLTVRSIEFDTPLVADGMTPSLTSKLALLLQEAYRHCKALGAWGSGTTILQAAAIPADAPGVLAGKRSQRPSMTS